MSLTAMLLLAACLQLLTAQRQPMTTADLRLKTFLRTYLTRSDAGTEKMTRYLAAFANLTDNGEGQVVVYLQGRQWCGTGGCTTLILVPEDSSYKVISSITVGWPPVRVLRTKTKGWHDLGIWVQGGGIQTGYEADISFDGKAYPSNPSIPPARRLTEKVAGKTVIEKDAVGVPLY
ncbi:MAG: hypothetical protein WBM04_00045 [Candidatus Korobacteraceae bacterium]